MNVVPIEIDITIEVPRGSFVKRGSSGRVDFVSPLPCPYNYGAADRFIGLEGDLLDAVLLGPRKPFGSRWRTLAWGAITLVDRGVADDKLICCDRPVTSDEKQGLLRFSGWTLDLRKHELTSPKGTRVELSGAEYGLLVVLLDNPQRVIGRERLLELSRTRLGEASDRSIDVLVSRLRRKFAQDEGGAALIRTMRGTGYMFAATVERL